MTLYPFGTYIAGRYEVVSHPLMGGMGLVYLCEDVEADRPVALKTFRPEFLSDRAVRDNFLREGTRWIDLGVHPHIVRCYGAERLHDGTEIYLVLELVANETRYPDPSLRSWLIPGRPLATETALNFALQVVRGMAYAVERIPGFAHLDLKPENLLVGMDRLQQTPANRLRITDFGMARALAGSTATALEWSVGPVSTTSHTMCSGSFAGTPEYAAPEQFEGNEFDGLHADVYALGCILLELLTGIQPVKAESRENRLPICYEQHRQGQALAATRSLPSHLQSFLGHCLALEPSERFGSWADVEATLAATYVVTTGKPAPDPDPMTTTSRAERVAVGAGYNQLGYSYLDIGQARTALAYFERTRAVGVAESDQPLEIAGMVHLGLAHADLGDAHRAIAYFERALEVAYEIGDYRYVVPALHNLGGQYAQLGEPHRAVSYHEQALKIAQKSGDPWSEGRAASSLGSAWFRMGDFSRALSYYEQSLAFDREIGDLRSEAYTLVNLGLVYYELGDLLRAIDFQLQALLISREIGDRLTEGNALGYLGTAYLDQGDAQRAIDYYEQRLAIAREIGDRRGEGHMLGNLGMAHRKLGDARRAIDYHKQSLAVAGETGDRYSESSALYNLGLAHLELGNLRRAIHYCEQALVISRDIGDRQSETKVLWSLGLLHHRQGNDVKAVAMMEARVAFEREMNHADAEIHATLVDRLRRGESLASGPSSSQILAGFGPLIECVVAAERGDRSARAAAESALEMLPEDAHKFVYRVKRIMTGERDEDALTVGIEPYIAIILREMLRRLRHR
ncbi:MAG: serine/threonine protein kinase [Chloroflexi bacterium]|nr:serine/threonine protein kinase [Chloroflexota bacterium]